MSTATELLNHRPLKVLLVFAINLLFKIILLPISHICCPLCQSCLLLRHPKIRSALGAGAIISTTA